MPHGSRIAGFIFSDFAVVPLPGGLRNAIEAPSEVIHDNLDSLPRPAKLAWYEFEIRLSQFCLIRLLMHLTNMNWVHSEPYETRIL